MQGKQMLASCSRALKLMQRTAWQHKGCHCRAQSAIEQVPPPLPRSAPHFPCFRQYVGQTAAHVHTAVNLHLYWAGSWAIGGWGLKHGQLLVAVFYSHCLADVKQHGVDIQWSTPPPSVTHSHCSAISILSHRSPLLVVLPSRCSCVAGCSFRRKGD